MSVNYEIKSFKVSNKETIKFEFLSRNTHAFSPITLF